MKRAVYFCLLLLSWAPHTRGMQTNLTNRTGRLRMLQGIVMDVQNLPVTDTVVRLWNDLERPGTKANDPRRQDGCGRALPLVEC
jgi:hypothetical protein